MTPEQTDALFSRILGDNLMRGTVLLLALAGVGVAVLAALIRLV